MKDDGRGMALQPLASHGRWNPGYITPSAEGLVSDSAIFNGREAVTAKLKVVVDPAVCREKTLRVAG